MTKLSSWVSGLAESRVLVVGDVMLDRFIYGDVERLSPEAPVPVLQVARERSMLGGAGNVVRSLAALQATPCFVTVVGNDSIGREVKLLCGQLTAKATFIDVADGQTALKTRYIAGGQQLLRADDEAVQPLNPIEEEQVIAAVRNMLPGKEGAIGSLILSDYGKGVLTSGLTRKLIGLARDSDVPVLVDPKGRDFSRYAGADVITPNQKELAEATGMLSDGDDDIVTAARHVIETCGIKRILVTRGAKGMALVGSDTTQHFAAQAHEVFDVSGAGDTVVAVSAAAVAVGADLSIAVQLANAAAGIAVSKSGTAVVRSAELAAAVDGAARGAIVSREEAAGRAAAWRDRGLRVGFTNGCFDLLHPGHIALLRQARDECDRLVVGINTDASVVRLKGPSRPVQDEASRASVLSALAMVDLVVSFAEDTPKELIEEIQPDVLVKGSDYTIDQVVGAAFIQSYGGRVVIADLMDGYSTTSTLSRLQES